MLKIISKYRFIIFICDIILIVASIYFAPVIRFGILLDPTAVFGIAEVVAIFIYFFALYVFNFYNLNEITNIVSYSLKFALAILAVNLFNASLFYIFNVGSHSSGIIAISGLCTFILLLCLRLAIVRYINVATEPLRLLIFGAGKAGKMLNELLVSEHEYELVGFVDDDESKKETKLRVFLFWGIVTT